jgi:DNA-binding LacI/PurR family transcriptional regulator
MAQVSPRAFRRVRRIGILCDFLEDHYQDQIVAGASKAALERSVELVCIAGGMLGAPGRYGAERNHLYHLIDEAVIDGLVVLSGTLGSHFGMQALERHLRRFAALPICSVAVALPGVSNVLVDNDIGMRAAIEHLIDVHECSEIAFIGGPDANGEAARRLAVFHETLAARELKADPKLIFSGDFRPGSGKRAVTSFYDTHGLRPQAIVAANDLMALGALSALRKRGIRVPRDTRLIGFDDIEEAHFSSPPLTTIDQKLQRQGQVALDLVLRRLDGEAPSDVSISTKLQLRASCGCATNKPLELKGPDTGVPFELAWAARREVVLAELYRASQGALGYLGQGWERELYMAMRPALPDGRAFLDRMDAAIHLVLEETGELDDWHRVVSTLRRLALECALNDNVNRARLESLFFETQTLALFASQRYLTRRRLELKRSMFQLVTVGSAIAAAPEFSQLLSVLKDRLPDLGVANCYVALYSPAGWEKSSLVIAYSQDGSARAHEPVLDTEMDTLKLLSALLDSCNATSSQLIESLAFDRSPIGFVVLKYQPGQSIVYESLRDQLSLTCAAAQQVVNLKRASVERDHQRRQGLREEAPHTEAQRGQLKELLQVVAGAIAELDRALVQVEKKPPPAGVAETAMEMRVQPPSIQPSDQAYDERRSSG